MVVHVQAQTAAKGQKGECSAICDALVMYVRGAHVEKARWWPRHAPRGRRPDTSMSYSASTHTTVQTARVAVAF